jgi:hypothetical protein
MQRDSGRWRDYTPPGLYTFVFTAKEAGTASTFNLNIDNFAVAEHPQVQVSPGSVSSTNTFFRFSSETDASGASDLITIWVQDAHYNPISTVSTDSIKLEFRGGTSTGELSPVTETATPGEYMAYFTGIGAGTAKRLYLKVDGVPLATEGLVQVTPGAASVSRTSVSLASPTVAVGKTDRITIAVRDSAGNAVTKLTSGDFLLSYAGGSGSGTFGPLEATKRPGVYVVTFTGATAGTGGRVEVSIAGVLVDEQWKIKVV